MPRRLTAPTTHERLNRKETVSAPVRTTPALGSLPAADWPDTRGTAEPEDQPVPVLDRPDEPPPWHSQVFLDFIRHSHVVVDFLA